MKSVLLVSAAALAGCPSAAFAEYAEGEQHAAIVVTGTAPGYKAGESATATRTDTPLLDVPQSVSIVTRARMDDQALRSMGDVLRYVPGVTVGQGEGNRDQITLRGQNTTADFFLDGVRDDVQYYRSLYNIERVEILKGPSALIFGRGGSGGVVNRVQKTPLRDGVRASASGSVNTFGAWDMAIDLNAPVTASGALRINGFYERLGNHRDFFDGERYGINPQFAIDLDGWRLGLSYEYVQDDRVPDRGIPSVATSPGEPNRPVRGHRDTFFGLPGVNRTGLEAHIGRVRLDGDLSDRLKWSTTVAYGNYDKYYTNVFANAAATADDGTVVLANYTDPTRRRNFIAQTGLVWDFAAAGTTNKVLLGLEYGDQHSTNQRRSGLFANGSASFAFDLANPVYPASVSFSSLDRSTVSDVRFFSAYVQDQVSLGEMFDIVIGARYDRFSIEGTDFIGGRRGFARTDDKVSPRLGLVFKPRPNLSLYGSYSQSFLPRSGDQFLSLTATQANLAPERFTSYEAGAKWDIRPELNATVALFQLDRTNPTTPDPGNVAATINVRATRTRGIETALTGRLLAKLQTSAAYTYQDASLTDNRQVRLAQVPRHQLAIWNRYDFTRTFGVGVGVVHQSSQFAAIRTAANTTRLPAFTRVDAALYFRPGKRFDIQLNVENLFDATYFPDAHNNNNISTGAPINARLTARLKL